MSSARPAPHRRLSRLIRTAAALAAAVALTACTHDEPRWNLTNVTGHLPARSFKLTGIPSTPMRSAAASRSSTSATRTAPTSAPKRWRG